MKVRQSGGFRKKLFTAEVCAMTDVTVAPCQAMRWAAGGAPLMPRLRRRRLPGRRRDLNALPSGPASSEVRWQTTDSPRVPLCCVPRMSPIARQP